MRRKRGKDDARRGRVLQRGRCANGLSRGRIHFNRDSRRLGEGQQSRYPAHPA
jgi:hypothetical protein